MKYITLILSLLLTPVVMHAQNWDYIKSSGEYYYGEGMALTEDEADNAALAALSSMISVHVSSDFNSTYFHEDKNNGLSHKEFVSNCVKTYTSSTLTNCERMTLTEGKTITVRRWLNKNELAKVFENRISKAKEMIDIADLALDKNRVGLALQYYYWAYSLIRSVQYPDDVKDKENKSLTLTLPQKISDIMAGIHIEIDDIHGEDVDLLFTYKGHPVSGMDFTYNDGRAECAGKVKDGRGNMQMMPGWDNAYCFVNVEYEYKALARGDNEIQSVIDVVPPCSFETLHSLKVNNKDNQGSLGHKVKEKDESGVHMSPTEEQVVTDDADYYSLVMGAMINALKKRSYTEIQKYMTIEGMEIFRDLISEGHGKIVGEPIVNIFKSNNGTAVARGLQMSFCYSRGKKSTFVEDVVFYFNKDKKIDNIAFGLGNIVENEILTRNAKTWMPEERELLMEFLENYRTAYCLKRIDYIKDIFSDDAIIIVGSVTKKRTDYNKADSSVKTEYYKDRADISEQGKQVIRYNRLTKDEYLRNLQACFRRNEFINIRFTETDFQRLDKFQNQVIYGIQLGQDYSSTTYSDYGYLYLMIDLTDKDEPFIKVRTWQPEYVPVEERYHSGWFY